MAIKHCEGKLGKFNYDDEMFTLKGDDEEHQYLHYNDDFKGQIELPKGLVDCSWMFSHCTLPEGFFLGDKFNTSKVVNMENMFYGCTFPNGFTLGEKFNTRKVVCMTGMFASCNFPEGFSLGDNFDTSNVTDMGSMFEHCSFSSDFSLGDKFDTSKVREMWFMFYDCKLPDGFSLGDKFDISNVYVTEGMFYDCVFPEHFSIGDKFVINPMEIETINMFKNARFPQSFVESIPENDRDVLDYNNSFGGCMISVRASDIAHYLQKYSRSFAKAHNLPKRDKSGSIRCDAAEDIKQDTMDKQYQ